jgi:hypothetical protein
MVYRAVARLQTESGPPPRRFATLRRGILRLHHERRMVDQTGASWNRVALWMRQLESLRRVS